jgi:hypothetical protein
MDSYKNPKLGKTYFSPSLEAFGQQDRKVRIASKVIDSGDAYAFATIKDEVILRHTKGDKIDISAKFLEDNRGIFVLSIQGYSAATNKPYNASFSFIGDEITTLLEFIANIRSVALDHPGSLNVTDEELRRMVLSRRQAEHLVVENEALFAEVISSSITRSDVVALGYRRKQLDAFRLLLEDPSYFAKVKSHKQCSDEAVWQSFFQKNPWIFGYGLNYIYLDSFTDKKLEQVVQGYRIGGHGKRVDALLRSKGVVSSLCFVEIKTHVTPLLGSDSYRSGCWPPSARLAGAVSQVQGTVSAAMESLLGKLAISDPEGFPTGEEAFNYAPKAYLVVGNLSEFVGDHGVNQEQFRSFELFRRNTLSPEVITFDELYERAKFIVHQNED